MTKLEILSIDGEKYATLLCEDSEVSFISAYGENGCLFFDGLEFISSLLLPQ